MHIRAFHSPDDKPAALAFIDGSQEYEYPIEPNRRIDETVADEHFAHLMERVESSGGCVFIAEDEGRAIGWGVFTVETAPGYVIEAERSYGYVAELYVVEEARGLGVGRALIAACEAETRKRGLNQIMLGVLVKNERAMRVYTGAGFAPYTAELRKYLEPAS